MMRLAGTVNYKTGQHARIVEADFALPAYPLAELVGELPDPSPARRADPPAGRVLAGEDPYKRIAPPEYFRRLAGITVPRGGLVSCPAPAHLDRHPSCSVGAEASRAGAATAGTAGRAARSTTSPPCCSAARGAANCAGPRSRAPARACERCSAMSAERAPRAPTAPTRSQPPSRSTSCACRTASTGGSPATTGACT